MESASTGWPQPAQKRASAGTGAPQPEQLTTGVAPVGRPQLAQKCEPHWIGAPQRQRGAVRGLRSWAAVSSSASTSLSRGIDRDHLEAALLEEVLAEPVTPVHLEHEAAQVADPLLACAHERSPLAAEGAGVWAGLGGDGAVALARTHRRPSRRAIGAASVAA